MRISLEITTQARNCVLICLCIQQEEAEVTLGAYLNINK